MNKDIESQEIKQIATEETLLIRWKIISEFIIMLCLIYVIYHGTILSYKMVDLTQSSMNPQPTSSSSRSSQLTGFGANPWG